MKVKSLLIVIGVALVSLVVFWLPFFAKTEQFWGITFHTKTSRQVGMETIVQNFDGLNYLVVAKTLYKPELIEEINKNFLTGNEPLYFTAHYPGLPLLIRGLDAWLTGPQAVLGAIILSNIILAIGIYLLYIAFAKNKRLVVALAILALFVPARMLSDRVVGSNEPLFMGMVFASLYFASKKKYWLSAILGSLSIVTRSPGILLFGGYCLAMLVNSKSQKHNSKQTIRAYLPYLLMPLTLIAIWAFYGYQHSNLLAYFQSGVSLNLEFPPFSIFGTNQEWISGMWREEIIYIYLVFGMGLLALKKRLGSKLDFARVAMLSYAGIYLISIFFVAHRDVARYSLPIAPIVLLGFEQVIENKWVRMFLLVMLIPIFLIGWQFVLQNVQPVADWSGLL